MLGAVRSLNPWEVRSCVGSESQPFTELDLHMIARHQILGVRIQVHLLVRPLGPSHQLFPCSYGYSFSITTVLPDR